MYTDDNNWVITTEVAIYPGGSDSNSLPPVWARVVSLSNDRWVRGHLRSSRPSYFGRGFGEARRTAGKPAQPFLRQPIPWGEHEAAWQEWPIRDESSGVELLSLYVDSLLNAERNPFNGDRQALLQGLLDNVVIPVYGSPPKDWTKLGSLLGASGGLAGAGVLTGIGPEQTGVMVLIGAGATVLLNVVVPASKALGRGLEYRIDQLFGTPPGPPDKP